ncbi:MAG: DUF3499 domain-containing protein [Acidimicrobiia bacterium]|nr:DUF3499 domain-containing protein [Acidimicrobiia bacterium]
MVRQCARPGCSAPAVATFNFNGLERVVWVGPLAAARALSAGDLCRRHADRLRPPLHWELRDVRSSSPNVSTAPLAPSRHVAPSPPPAEQLPFAPATVRPAAVAVPAHPNPLRRDRTPPDRVRPASAPATTPMLARAFRAAG